MVNFKEAGFFEEPKVLYLERKSVRGASKASGEAKSDRKQVLYEPS